MTAAATGPWDLGELPWRQNDVTSKQLFSAQGMVHLIRFVEPKEMDVE